MFQIRVDFNMNRLEKKKIYNNDYYYYSEWAWENGKCRRVSQKYLGRLGDIVTAVEQGHAVKSLRVLSLGMPIALYAEACSRDFRPRFGEVLGQLALSNFDLSAYGDYVLLNAIRFGAESAVTGEEVSAWVEGTALCELIDGVCDNARAAELHAHVCSDPVVLDQVCAFLGSFCELSVSVSDIVVNDLQGVCEIVGRMLLQSLRAKLVASLPTVPASQWCRALEAIRCVQITFRGPGRKGKEHHELVWDELSELQHNILRQLDLTATGVTLPDIL